MATGRASDTTQDKPLCDEDRKILNGAKRNLVLDMDAEEVLLCMAADNVFTATEEDRIKTKPTRAEKNEQMLEILPRKGTKAYEIFKKVLQQVHPPLANVISERETDMEQRSADGARQAPFTYTETVSQEKISKRTIFSDLVSEEGSLWTLKKTGVFINFFRGAVPDPRLVTCLLWKPGTGSPPPDDNESLVSNVIELHCDDPHNVVFSSIEVALSHSAFCLRGYELVLKEMADSESSPWTDLYTSEVQLPDLQGECSEQQSELPFVKAKITRFSRYAVICRLKKFKLRMEGSGKSPELTIKVPDFPGFCLSVPGTSFPASMDLVIKVQELSSDDFEGKRVLVGPIVHITFTAKVELRDPSQVSLTCPISIRVPIGSQQDKKLLGTSSWRVRVYFRGGGDTLRKWIDRAEELKVPPKLQDGIVTLEVDGIDTFRIDHFSECLVVLDSSTESPDAEELFIVDSSCPQHVGFLAFWCSEKEKQPRQDTKQGLLTLCCFPLHMKTEATKEISSEHGFPLYGEAKSARKLARGDQALFSLSNGLTSVDERIDRDRVQFTGERILISGPFSVRFHAPTIEFFKKEKDKEGREKLCSLWLYPMEPFEDRSSVSSEEKPQLEEEPPLSEPSTSVDDSAEIEELRKSVVTQRLATLLKEDIGSCWSDLGPFLEVPESELRNIGADYVEAGPKGCAVLQSWRDRKGRKATVGRLVSVLTAIGKKRIADNFLDIVRKEKQRESKHHKTCSSPVEESETGQRQAGEREGFPETMTSNAEEVYASETRDIEPSERRDEGKQREKEQREIDELKESLKNVGEMKQTVTKLESELNELHRGQENTRRNDPFEMLHNLLKEVAALKEVVEKKAESRTENENVEGLREMTEKVRQVRQDFSGAS